MSGETLITVVGNITGDPELRFTPSGAAVANFTIASTPRKFDRQANEWKDGDTLFMRCSIWRDAAENVAESLVRGTRVLAQGFLEQRSYDTKEGEKRTVVELNVQEIGPSLRYASAKVNRTQRQGAPSSPAQGSGEDPWAQGPSQPVERGQQAQAAPQQGSWGQQGSQGGGQGWGGNAPSYDEPPF
jgi:single-strand DNA-binding protein